VLYNSKYSRKGNVIFEDDIAPPGFGLEFLSYLKSQVLIPGGLVKLCIKIGFGGTGI
jgi:hypothetical protein